MKSINQYISLSNERISSIDDYISVLNERITSIDDYITEKLIISKSNKSSYNYFPKTGEELRKLLKQLIEERGNYGDFNDIDTSEINNMDSVFSNYNWLDFKNFNGNISEWDVSNVTNMSHMFYDCESFNQPLDKWDVSKVTNMNQMFKGCRSFNQDISNWNVSNVTNMKFMFERCPINEKYRPKFK